MCVRPIEVGWKCAVLRKHGFETSKTCPHERMVPENPQSIASCQFALYKCHLRGALQVCQSRKPRDSRFRRHPEKKDRGSKHHREHDRVTSAIAAGAPPKNPTQSECFNQDRDNPAARA